MEQEVGGLLPEMHHDVSHAPTDPERMVRMIDKSDGHAINAGG